jgi:hypothetical protein
MMKMYARKTSALLRLIALQTNALLCLRPPHAGIVTRPAALSACADRVATAWNPFLS